MSSISIFYYSILLIPLLGVLFAGYSKMKMGQLFGLTIFLGALSSVFTYIYVDFFASLVQFGVLGFATLLTLALIGLLGNRFSYRSPVILMASIGLFPIGLLVAKGLWIPVLIFAIATIANILFSLFLVFVRDKNLRLNREDFSSNFIMVIPSAIVAIVVGLMVIVGSSV